MRAVSLDTKNATALDSDIKRALVKHLLSLYACCDTDGVIKQLPVSELVEIPESSPTDITVL